jgi:riboflavin transporter FmnP
MVYLTFIFAYLIVAIAAALARLMKINTSDAPIFQLTFALSKGLCWPLLISKNRTNVKNGHHDQ